MILQSFAMLLLIEQPEQVPSSSKMHSPQANPQPLICMLVSIYLILYKAISKKSKGVAAPD
jgi:hypothetical protein